MINSNEQKIIQYIVRNKMLSPNDIQQCLNLKKGTEKSIIDIFIKQDLLSYSQIAKINVALKGSDLHLPGIQLFEKLGEGGMGTVYRGMQTKLEREVAVKFLQLEEEALVSRFFQEARLLAKIDHPNIVRIIDFGFENASHYYIMEYIKGEDISRYVKRVGVLSETEAIHIIWKVAEALECLYQKNIVHRDIKPSNIVLGKDGKIKLCDLGLAKQKQEKGITRTGAVIGTPHFMSPEQIDSSDIDIRSDIYSLGATLYYMLSNSPPYDGNFSSIAYQHVHKAVPKLPQKNISKFTRQLLEKMMAKDIKKRIQTPSDILKTIKSSTLNYAEVNFSINSPLTEQQNDITTIEPPAQKTKESSHEIESPINETKFSNLAVDLKNKKKSKLEYLFLVSAITICLLIACFPLFVFLFSCPLFIFIYLYPQKFSFLKNNKLRADTQFFIISI
ncbi:serine/threonine-protein kinase [Candidatus Uabimicrobium sp. HlEnr_7]|uniref:serine/threonine-protein kinase n=1 Tax=Candidatus Uabimicrobium helgolandensis TaxID=3095367 RepID=UPI0035588E3B